MKIQNPTLDQKMLLAAGWEPLELDGEIRWVSSRGETTSAGTTEAGAMRIINRGQKPDHQYRCEYCKKPMAVKRVNTGDGTVVTHYPRRHKNIAGGLCPGVREPAIPVKKAG